MKIFKDRKVRTASAVTVTLPARVHVGQEYGYTWSCLSYNQGTPWDVHVYVLDYADEVTLIVPRHILREGLLNPAFGGVTFIHPASSVAGPGWIDIQVEDITVSLAHAAVKAFLQRTDQLVPEGRERATARRHAPYVPIHELLDGRS